MQEQDAFNPDERDGEIKNLIPSSDRQRESETESTVDGLDTARDTPARGNSRHEAFISGLHLDAGDLTDSDMRKLAHVMALPWGDLGPTIQVIQETLVLLMLLTPDEFSRWENDLSDRYSSEFEIPVEYALELSIEERFAHVARLIRSLGMFMGLKTDYVASRDDIGDIEVGSPAYVLRELDNLSRAIAARKTSLTDQSE